MTYQDGKQATAERYQLQVDQRRRGQCFVLYQMGECGTVNAVSWLVLAQAFYWFCRGLALIIKALKH